MATREAQLLLETATKDLLGKVFFFGRVGVGDQDPREKLSFIAAMLDNAWSVATLQKGPVCSNDPYKGFNPTKLY
jgi:hypothetical protein